MTACARAWSDAMAGVDRHTRVVGWLKVALPLLALAILSTLFLLSRPDRPRSRPALCRGRCRRPGARTADDRADLCRHHLGRRGADPVGG